MAFVDLVINGTNKGHSYNSVDIVNAYYNKTVFTCQDSSKWLIKSYIITHIAGVQTYTCVGVAQ